MVEGERKRIENWSRLDVPSWDVTKPKARRGGGGRGGDWQRKSKAKRSGPLSTTL